MTHRPGQRHSPRLTFRPLTRIKRHDNVDAFVSLISTVIFAAEMLLLIGTVFLIGWIIT